MWKMQFSSIQSLSLVLLFTTPWTAVRQASLSITNSWSLFKLMSIESVIQSNQLILCHPVFLLPSIFPRIRFFPMSQYFTSSGQSYWSFNFSISPSNEYSGLISFRVDWFDLKALSRIFSSTTIRRHQFFRSQPSLWSISHTHAWRLKKP